MAMSSFLLSLPPHHQKPLQNPILPLSPDVILSRRLLIFTTTSLSSVLSLALQRQHIPISSAAKTPSPSSILAGIVNTKSWYQFYGDGFSIRVPPEFQDILEPEDYNAGMSLYGDKAKPRTFAARFASSDGSEVLSVVTRPSNQLKITFLEYFDHQGECNATGPIHSSGHYMCLCEQAKDITDFGSLKEAARIFVPDGATLYSARTIKIKEDESFRTYYFYEFGRNEQHIALVAAVNSGKAIIAGATAPQSKWDDDSLKLRSAAISLTVL